MKYVHATLDLQELTVRRQYMKIGPVKKENVTGLMASVTELANVVNTSLVNGAKTTSVQFVMQKDAFTAHSEMSAKFAKEEISPSKDNASRPVHMGIMGTMENAKNVHSLAATVGLKIYVQTAKKDVIYALLQTQLSA